MLRTIYLRNMKQASKKGPTHSGKKNNEGKKEKRKKERKKERKERKNKKGLNPPEDFNLGTILSKNNEFYDASFAVEGEEVRVGLD